MADVRDRRFFDYDPLLGHTEYFHYDPETDGFAIETVADVEPLIEVNKYLHNNAPLRWGEWTHVASLPSVIVTHLINRRHHVRPWEKSSTRTAFEKWLNDRDNRASSARGPAMSERPRVMIATPCTDMVKAGFALDLPRCTVCA
jgi:hypothetical protein